MMLSGCLEAKQKIARLSNGQARTKMTSAHTPTTTKKEQALSRMCCKSFEVYCEARRRLVIAFPGLHIAYA